MLRSLLLLLPAAAVCFAQSADSFEYFRPEKDVARKAAAGAVEAIRAGLPRAAERVLAPLEAASLAIEEPGIGPKRTGLHRRLDAETLAIGRWETTANGRSIWRAAIRSTGAAGVRVHFRKFDAGKDAVWIHDGETSDGPYSGRGIHGDGDFWSAVAFGEVVTIEYMPAEERGAGPVPFEVPEIAHLWKSADPTKATSEPNAVAPCHVDVTCVGDWAEAARSVARLTFEKDGGSYFCTGSLLTTTDRSLIPYFLTAQHCMDDDATARTVVAYWTYQTPTCNGRAPATRGLPVSIGARFVAGGDFEGADFTLLRLNDVPNGVIFSGWTAAEPALGEALVGIHHPAGDFKRISQGVRDSDRRIVSVPQQNFYTVRWSAGRTEGGSSGSPIFNSRKQVVGTLSHGPKAPPGQTVCDIEPIDFYGRFSVQYRTLRRFLDPTGGTTPPANPSQQVGGTLVSGQAREFSLPSVTGGTLFNGSSAYQIEVPSGSSRLEIRLSTATPSVNVSLFARFGSEPTVSSGSVVADHTSNSPGGQQLIAITPQSTPSLRTGTYFIALGLLTPGRAVTGTIVATITQAAAGGAGGIQLESGAPRGFRFAAFREPVLLNGDSSYRIDVPEGATRLDVKLATNTPGVDVDVYVSYARDNRVNTAGNAVTADYRSEGETGDEEISITGSNTPPLRAGTYYVSLLVYTTGREASGTITATVAGRPRAAPSAPFTLTPGSAAPFSLPATERPTLFSGNYQYKIVVPPNSAKLDIRLRTANANTVDVDLYVRRDADVELGENTILADWSSTRDTGNEDLTITTRSEPGLAPGTYSIALVVWTTGVAATGTVTAAVTPAVGQEMISGESKRFSLPQVTSPALFGGDAVYRVYVPPGAVKLEFAVSTESPGVDVDVHARFEQEPRIADGKIVSDFASEGPFGEETIVIDPGTDPPLTPGTYYFSLVLYSTGSAAEGTVAAAITMGESASSAKAAHKVPGSVKAWTGGSHSY